MGERSSRPSRITELDAVRGLAAMGILLFHLPLGFWFGETGVDLFFVLSGFLITSIILSKCQEKRFLFTFYVRRSLRIWPIYYLAIGVVVAMNLMRRSPDPLHGLPFYLVYLQDIQRYWGGVPPAMTSSLAHTWTLAIEEQFYLIWPPLLLLVGRKYATHTALFFACLPAVLRAFGLSGGVLFGHCDGLALGALLASLKLDAAPSSSRRESITYLAIFLGTISLYVGLWLVTLSSGHLDKRGLTSYNCGTILISLSYFGLVGFLVSNAGRNCLRWLRIPALIYLGQLSYGLYLYHWIVYELIDTKVKFGMGYQDPWWLDLVKVGASVAVAMLSWHLVEQPILRLKERFTYSGGRDAGSTRRPEVTPADPDRGPQLDPIYELDVRPVT